MSAADAIRTAIAALESERRAAALTGFVQPIPGVAQYPRPEWSTLALHHLQQALAAYRGEV